MDATVKQTTVFYGLKVIQIMKLLILLQQTGIIASQELKELASGFQLIME